MKNTMGSGDVVRRTVRASLLALLLPLAPCPARAAAQTIGQAPPPHGHLRTILEKTFLKVDVLALDVCVDETAAARLADFAALKRDRPLEDSVARTTLAADRVLGRITFLRDVSYSQFLGGILEEQKHAVEAGWLADSTYRSVSAALPEWFSFLENRNIRKDEQILYHIHGDSIRTVFIDNAGAHQLDRTDIGWWRRTSVLATWFAPGSGFRDGLVRSAWNPPSATAACAEPPS
jgi:hypothetical protein